MDESTQNLPEMMRRATDGLEPDSPDLVRRGMQKGLRMRRRRTAGLSVAAATALVLTGAVVVSARSIGPDRADAQVAGTSGPSAPASKPPAKPSTARPAASKDTLDTLRKMVPAGFKVSDLEHRGDSGFTAASITVDDGRGLSELGVLIERREVMKRCPAPGAETGYKSCKKLSDGTVVLRSALEPVYGPFPKSTKFPTGRHPNDRGVRYNSVALHRRDGVVIAMVSYTSRDEKNSPNTRQKPPFSVAQLTSMAQSKLWKAPAAKPDTPKAK